MKELLEENKRLKERVEFLEKLLNRKNTGHSSAYNAIREMIIAKVEKEVNIPEYLLDWQKKDTRQRAERQIEKAKEYIEKYELAEEFRKSRWEKENVSTNI